MGTPHGTEARETEMSSSPPLITLTTSLRRMSGWMNSGCAAMWSSSGCWYFDRRKKKFFSRIVSGTVPCTGHLPSTRSFSW